MGKIRGQSLAYTLLGYIVLAVIIILVFAIVAATVYWSAFHVSDESLANWGKWAGFAAWTAVLFGYVMKQRRRLRSNHLFWSTLAGLLFVHTAGFSVILRNVEHWRMVWFLLIWPVEFALIATTLTWMMDRFGNRHRGVVTPPP
jgi:cell division protein FtsW (lipid II flippase)